MSAPAHDPDRTGLIRHGTVLVLGTFFGAICNAGFHMTVGRTLSNAEYGSLAAMLGLVLVTNTPMLAVQNTLAHYISCLLQEGRRSEVRAFFRHWIRLFAAISGAIVLGAFLSREALAAFWGGVNPWLVVATFAVLATSLWMSLFFGLLQGVQSFTWLAWAPQAWGVVRLVLGWGLTVFVSATALVAILAQGAGVLSVLLLGLWAMLGLRLPHDPDALHPPGTYRYLGSALACLTGYAMLMNLDVTMAKHYFDAETAGLFSKAAIIARTAVFMPVPIATALFPKVASTGELSEGSWKLLGQGLAYAAVLIAGAAGVCLVLPHLPWFILYGRWSPETAGLAAALTRAMVLAVTPLAFAYLLLNFEMAQRRFTWCYSLIPAGATYIGGVMRFHAHPLQLPAVLGILNLVVALLLAAGILFQRRRK